MENICEGMDRVNRNAAGFRFFKYFMENLIIDEETFDYYNKFIVQLVDL